MAIALASVPPVDSPSRLNPPQPRPATLTLSSVLPSVVYSIRSTSLPKAEKLRVVPCGGKRTKPDARPPACLSCIGPRHDTGAGARLMLRRQRRGVARTRVEWRGAADHGYDISGRQRWHPDRSLSHPRFCPI